VKSQLIVLLELVVVLNKGIYGKKIINVCCNLKRVLYLGTKRKTKGGYIKGRREYKVTRCRSNITVVAQQKMDCLKLTSLF